MSRDSEAYEVMASSKANCAQTVLAAFSEAFGLPHDIALKLAGGFGGGMGRSGRVCGAVTGAYMVLGLAQLKENDSPRESAERTHELIQQFDRMFTAQHSSLVCRELTGYDISLPEARAAAREAGVFTTLCPELVRSSVRILETLLQPWLKEP